MTAKTVGQNQTKSTLLSDEIL